MKFEKIFRGFLDMESKNITFCLGDEERGYAREQDWCSKDFFCSKGINGVGSMASGHTHAENLCQRSFVVYYSLMNVRKIARDRS